MGNVSFFLIAVGLLSGAMSSGQAESRQPFTVGVCTHFSQGKGIIELNLQCIKAAGITAIRDEAGWQGVEQVKGRYRMSKHNDRYVRAAASMGLNVMMILDYANPHYDDGDRPRSREAIEGFCRYAEFMVQHFGKDIRLYEIWNEWDIGIGLPKPYNKGGSAEDYYQLLKAVYPRLKAIDPNIIVVAGASTSGGVHKGWLNRIVELGALNVSDAISIHAYNYSEAFPNRSPERCSLWMAGVQTMLREHNNGQDVPFYVTEMGWPNQIGKRGTEPGLSASYLARLYLLARQSPSFCGLWWYDFQDDGWNPEHNENNFGIVKPDLTPKPHFHVMADVAKLVAHGQYLGTFDAKDEDVKILRFSLNNKDVWALWSSDDQQRQVILQKNGSLQSITVHQLGHKPMIASWGFRDWPTRGELMPDRFSVVVDHRPILISGDLQGVSVAQTVDRHRKPTYEHHR